MNNQSPLVPQGSLVEQKNKGRARVKIAVFFVLGIHGIGLLALLMQGCRNDGRPIMRQLSKRRRTWRLSRPSPILRPFPKLLILRPRRWWPAPRNTPSSSAIPSAPSPKNSMCQSRQSPKPTRMSCRPNSRSARRFTSRRLRRWRRRPLVLLAPHRPPLRRTASKSIQLSPGMC